MSQPESQAPRDIISTVRLEAFSDGVIAIAITLLIIELHLPELSQGESLWDGIRQILPNIAAFIVSFSTIGVMWINHHNVFRLIDRVDQTLLVLNTVLLLMITFVNFPTAVLGEHLLTDQFQNAMIFYTGTFVVTASVYSLAWRYASHKDRLMGDNPNRQMVNTISRNYVIGWIAYVVTFVLSFISPALALVSMFVLAVFFALPINR